MISCAVYVDVPNELIFHEFVFCNICQVPLRPCLKKDLKILKNWKKIKFYCSDTSVKNIQKNDRNGFFKKKNHIFSTWIWFLHVFSFLLRYITYVLVKIFKFLFFLSIKFLSMTNFIPWPLVAEIVIKRDCFWYLWTGKDQNIYLRPCLAVWGSY